MSKVKIKQIKKVVGDVDLNNMFEEMMGIKDAELDIIIPKFVLVRNTIRYICRVLNQFSTFAILRSDFPEISDGLDEVKKFADEIKEATYLKHDHDEKETQYANVSKEDLNGLYRKLKENPYVKRLIILCNVLEKYKMNFNDTTKLKENFVNQEPGLSFKIFDFSSLDLKILWSNSKLNVVVKRYILSVLASLHKHTYALYNIITSPDVDIDKFTKLLLSSIGELRKQPKLHRCNAAFKRIEQSVELLKGKFSDYYRESLASRNPDSLVTSFIVDVSNQGGADARLTREFRQIIQYMHEISQKSGKSKDPQVQKIFAMLNSNFALMEKHTKGKKDKDVDKDVDTTAENPENTEKTEDKKETTEPAAVPDVDPAEIAEEKRTKRLEKQKAKKKKRNALKKSQATEIADAVNAINTADTMDNTDQVDAVDTKDNTDTGNVTETVVVSDTPSVSVEDDAVNELEALILKKTE
jgi:hypothetical protein